MAGLAPLPRDPRTDRSNPADWLQVGSVNPKIVDAEGLPVPQPVALGRARSLQPPLDRATRRPNRWEDGPVLVQARDLGRTQGGTVNPGTIRRNVSYPIAGGGGTGFFNWATNRSYGGGRAFQPTSSPRYLVTSFFLGLASPLKWPILGVKPPIPDGPDGQRLRQMAEPSTGWPVIAPSVPSYGSRVPLLRPRGLVTNES